MARIISEVRPRYTFIENSPMLSIRGLESVLADLAKMGFDAEWGVLSAADVGANHLRERIWIVGKNTQQSRFFSRPKHNGDGWGEQQSQRVEKTNGTMAHAKSTRTSKDFGGLRQGVERVNRGQDTDTKMADTRCELRIEGDTGNLVANQTKRSASPIFNQSSGSRFGFDNNWWEIEPDVGRVAYGVAAGMDRLKAVGNGQVPQVAAIAWELLTERLNERDRPQ
jgi:DNA (cytosine-5)-methyltransferase 1